MQRWMVVLIVFCVGVIAFPRDGSAQIPRTLSYQGILSDTLGTPKPDGMYAITFRLYDAPSGGTLLWVETQSLQVKRGLFSAVLGSQTPFPSSVTFERQYWLGIQPAGNPELLPRIALSAVGYSLNALRADTARVALNAGIFADSARIAGTVPNNSITANKIAAGQVVKSINNIRDAVTLRAQGGATITSSGDTITINAGSGGGGTGVQSIQNTNNTIDIISPTGPTVTANLKVPLSLSGSSISPIISGANSGSGIGVYGFNSSSGNYGYLGTLSYGVYGAAPAASGLTYGVRGVTSSTTTNAAGVRGEAAASSGETIGVEGVSTASLLGIGVVGRGSWRGVLGESTSGIGVYATSTGGIGLYATSTNAEGVAAYSAQGNAINGFSSNGWGVVGAHGANSGTLGGSVYGVEGRTYSTTTLAAGVRGEAAAGSGQTIGVEGVSTASPQGTGVAGRGNATGGYFTASNGTGVQGFGITGGFFESSTGDGVYGSSGGGPNTAGVHGYGSGPNSTGVWGQGSGQGSNTAGWFSGNVWVTGTLSKGAGSFRIDHPLDPANKYLYHSFVESPDMMNIYNGNVTLDGNGEAVVTLPAWFEALNKEFRYQLTCIGGFAPVYIAQKISGNRFKIAGGNPGMEVSWQVTGIRHDPFAEAHRIQVEVEKTGRERGKYIHPKEYGVSETLGIEYEAYQKMKADQEKMQAEHERRKAELERMQAEHEKMNLERQRMRPQPLGK